MSNDTPRSPQEHLTGKWSYGPTLVAYDTETQLQAFMRDLPKVADPEPSDRPLWVDIGVGEPHLKKNIIDENKKYPMYVMVRGPKVSDMFGGVSKWMNRTHSHIRSLGQGSYANRGNNLLPQIQPFFAWNHGMSPEIFWAFKDACRYGARAIVLTDREMEWCNQTGDFTDRLWYNPPKPK